MSMKNSNDTIGNRIRDLPACDAVPQPTAPPRASPLMSAVRYFIGKKNNRVTDASEIYVLQWYFARNKSYRNALSLQQGIRVTAPITSHLIYVTAKKILHFLLCSRSEGLNLWNTL
jgi:hypothetical protein